MRIKVIHTLVTPLPEIQRSLLSQNQPNQNFAQQLLLTLFFNPITAMTSLEYIWKFEEKKVSWKNDYKEWFVPSEEVYTSDSEEVSLWTFEHEDDEIILSKLAEQFRNQYCPDDQIDSLRDGTGLSRSDYLTDICFPDKIVKPGPSLRSGDFGEILVVNVLEHRKNYWIPSNRFIERSTRHDPVKGYDIIGFKQISDDRVSQKDSLVIFEVKTKLKDKTRQKLKTLKILQIAVDDVKIKEHRLAETLNAIKRRLLREDNHVKAKLVGRYQNKKDKPFSEIYGAAAIIDESIFSLNCITGTDTSKHILKGKLRLMVIKGENLANFLNELYRRAADEA